MNLAEFIKKYDGRGIDFDGYAGYQCFDLYRAYCKEVLNVPQSPPTGDRGAVTIKDNYLRDYFNWIVNSPDGIPSFGDIVIWGTSYGPYGHVAIFTDGNATTMTCFSQNDPGGALCGLKIYKSYKGVLGWLTPKTIMKGDEMITEQTKIPLGGEWGEMEVQAIRSKLNDLSVNNASLALSLKQAKDDLDTEAHANQAQVKALSDSLDSEKKSRLDDMVTIAKALGSEVTPNLDSIIRQIAVLGKHDDQLDASQRLNKTLIQKPFLAVMEEFIIKLFKRK